MRLLARIDGSVLWLSHMNDCAMDNLRRAAAARGIDPARVIFAPRLDRIEDHLARHRQADLFLDTLPYKTSVPVKVPGGMSAGALVCKKGPRSSLWP